MEKIPKPEHGSDQWLLNRWRDADGKTTFGASEAPALMGASPYQSRAGLYVAKSQPPKPSEDNPVFRRGHVLEPALLGEAGYLLGITVLTPEVQYRRGRFTISMDGVDNEDHPTIGIEAKTTTKYSISSSGDLPAEWLWQGWAQQLVLGCPIKFVVLDRNMSISMVDLPDNPAALAELQSQSEWFGNLIDAQELPEWDLDEFDSDDIAAIYKHSPASVELPSTAVDLVWVLEDARAQRRAAEKAEQAAKDALARLLQGHEIGTVDGQPIVSWKEYQGRQSLDTKALQADHPELCAQYQKQGASYRTMKALNPRKEG
jgi:predicted phage-related endonuclease